MSKYLKHSYKYIEGLDYSQSPLVFPRISSFEDSLLSHLVKGTNRIRNNTLMKEYTMMLAILHNKTALLNNLIELEVNLNSIIKEPTDNLYWHDYDPARLREVGTPLSFAIMKMESLHDADTVLQLLKHGADTMEDQSENLPTYEFLINIIQEKVDQSRDEEMIFKFNLVKTILFLKQNKLNLDETLLNDAIENIETIVQRYALNENGIYQKSEKDRIEKSIEVDKYTLISANTGIDATRLSLNLTLSKVEAPVLIEANLKGVSFNDPDFHAIVLNQAYLETVKSLQRLIITGESYSPVQETIFKADKISGTPEMKGELLPLPTSHLKSELKTIFDQKEQYVYLKEMENKTDRALQYLNILKLKKGYTIDDITFIIHNSLIEIDQKVSHVNELKEILTVYLDNNKISEPDFKRINERLSDMLLLNEKSEEPKFNETIGFKP